MLSCTHISPELRSNTYTGEYFFIPGTNNENMCTTLNDLMNVSKNNDLAPEIKDRLQRMIDNKDYMRYEKRYKLIKSCQDANEFFKQHRDANFTIPQEINIKLRFTQVKGEPLGSGSFGSVVLIEFSPLHRCYAAMKIFQDVIPFQKEWNVVKTIMSRIAHIHNIMQVYCVFNLKIVYEYINGQMLKHYISKINNFEKNYSNHKLHGDVNSSDVLKFFKTPNDALEFRYKIVKNVVGAMKKMHEASVFHSDIKPANLMWDITNMRIVIIDFGFASTRRMHGSSRGTPTYYPPEYANATSFDVELYDIFAMGISLVELFSRAYQSTVVVKNGEKDVIRFYDDPTGTTLKNVLGTLRGLLKNNVVDKRTYEILVLLTSSDVQTRIKYKNLV